MSSLTVEAGQYMATPLDVEVYSESADEENCSAARFRHINRRAES